MKRILFFAIIFLLPSMVIAQGKSQGKGKEKNKGKSEQTDKSSREKSHDNIVWEGTGGRPKPSKNQPAKVRAAFWRDYPNASNVRWSKYRGDWTATFGNGLFTSTAVYHANGERRDTRTPIESKQLPGSIWDVILKRKPETKLSDIIKIEVPQAVKDIFRVKTILDGAVKFLFYNSDGKEVKYNY